MDEQKKRSGRSVSKRASGLLPLNKSAKPWVSLFLGFMIVGMAISLGWWFNSHAVEMRYNENASRGLEMTGLNKGRKGSLCANLYEITNGSGLVIACTHGPDPAPENVDVRTSVKPVEYQDNSSELGQPLEANAIPCDGDGISGYRTQAVYVRASDRPDRYDQFAESLQKYAAAANTIYEESAKQTGGSRSVRFVTDADCKIVFERVTLSTTGDDTFAKTISEMKSQGYNKANRKYIMWSDANIYCGIGQVYVDDRKSQDNYNNGAYAMYGRIDSGCWGGNTEAHELMHTLGGVQKTAPNSNGMSHCNDEYDRMCYQEGSNSVVYSCASNQEARFDCNKDDYFHTNPQLGSYLASHWNTADSKFLQGMIAPELDVIQPTVSLTSPVEADTVTGMVQLMAEASDNVAVSRVDFTVDGSLIGSDTTFTYSTIWDTATLNAGTYSLAAKAYDVAGNIGVSQEAQVTLVKVARLGDVNEDGLVNALDLSKVLSGYDKINAVRLDGDLNGDGVVNALDLSQVLTNYDS